MGVKKAVLKRKAVEDNRSPKKKKSRPNDGESKKKSRPNDGESTSNAAAPVFRCKTKGVVEGNSLIAYRVKSHRIKRYLYEAGFNGFLELQNKQHNRDLIDLLVKSFDPLSKTFHIGGSVFRV
ncbi:hypothetical protein LINGRAHAP2_LOCUS32863, partial [Linum grandiflorum]